MSMKKVREIVGFDNFEVYNNSIVVQDKKGICLVENNLELTPLVEGNIYSIQVLGNNLFYQIDDALGLYLLEKGLILNKDSFYGLMSALMYNEYIYIERENLQDEINTPIFLNTNSDFHFISNAPEYCNFSYKQYLIRNNNRKKIFNCYQLNDKLWSYKHTDDSNIEILSGYKDKILIYSKSGDLFALDLQTGGLCWRYPEPCFSHNSLYGDFIYTFNKSSLLEISAETGKLCRVMDMESIEKKEYFTLTAGIKAYDDYIFGRDVDGVVIIIDRKSLTLKKILRFDKHLINRDHTLQWIHNRLYVQDIEYTLHIFE
ncbi:hypothetical protein FACS1894169_04710 [Bacteroidia bacterium]|nr:hypothetical protein FACS1894169_04710 [Bacteroidia bacterium]